jgi:broad specificity phosphatase PhoE
MKLYIVRHGQTDYNLNDLLQGWTDNPLNQEGLKQAEEISKILKNYKIEVIFSSDLKRAIQTAQIIQEANPHKPGLTIDSRIREQFMGDWEGKNFKKVLAENESFFRKAKENPLLYNPPNGEKFLDVIKRVKNFLEEL